MKGKNKDIFTFLHILCYEENDRNYAKLERSDIGKKTDPWPQWLMCKAAGWQGPRQLGYLTPTPHPPPSPFPSPLRASSFREQDKQLLNLPGPIVIKKMMSPCSIWQGLWALLKSKGTFVYTKEGTRVPSPNTGGLVCTRRTKQGIGGKCLWLGQMRQVKWAAAQHLLKPLLGGKIASWLWGSGATKNMHCVQKRGDQSLQ